MPFDGIFAKYTAQELDTALKGGRIGKIHQMNRDAVIIPVRANGGNYRLLVSSNAACARIHLTEKQYENPETPPVFCMLLRKHLSGGIIKGFYTDGFERIITMEAEVTDELGDRSAKKLVTEIMGRHSNIILLNKDNKIIDAIKHVDFEVNRVRELLPARTYVLPPAQNKSDPDDPDTYELLMREAPSCSRKTESFLLDRLKGFSPVLCREICFRAGVDSDKPASGLEPDELKHIIDELDQLMNGLKKNGPSPVIIFDDSTGKVVDFHCISLAQYRSAKNFDLIGQAVDTFYNLKNSKEFNNQQTINLQKHVSKHLEKCEKRLDINLRTYEENKGYESLRLFGELVTANIYALAKGMDTAKVVNYYSKTGEQVEIPLVREKSPQENAQLYFRRYNKSKTAYLYAQQEIEKLKEEIAYLESVLYSIDNAGDSSELGEIRTELYEQGYISSNGKKGKSGDKSGRKKQRPVKAVPLRVISQDGFEVFIGLNNRQNDRLTLKTAQRGDMWLHIKNFPGSHVIIRTEGREIPPSALEEAAGYAAWFSKARSSPKAEVDYTQVRNVKKPSGAKPGMVIYTNYSTIITAPKKPKELKESKP